MPILARTKLLIALLVGLFLCEASWGQQPQTVPTTPTGQGVQPAVVNRYPTNPPIAPTTPVMGVTPGNVNRCGYDAWNLPPQPQVAAGRCQACMLGIDCADNCGKRRQTWRDMHPYNFGPLAHGEYLGPVRLPSNVDYRLRVGDRLRFTYITSREILTNNFPLRVGDELEISSTTDELIKLGDLAQGRGIVIQQDGMLVLKQLGSVRAAGLTIDQLRYNLNEAYKSLIQNPAVDVIPIKTNTLLEDIRDAVDARAGQGGQAFIDTVHPDGTIRLPKLGGICVLGMTLDEVKREVNLRYREIVAGLEVEPVLDEEASHFVFVYGQVGEPGRFEMEGPTSVSQALALAQGTILGANLREIVIFRRAEDWRLIATRVDLRGALLGKAPLPTDEIWLRDGDLIIVPKTPIQRFDEFVQQVFTDGAYAIFPFAQLGAGFDVGAGVVGQ